MAVTVATFRLRFPEFGSNTDFPDPRIQLFIDDANEDVDSSKFSAVIADRIISYLVAHYLTLATNSADGDPSSTGIVASKSEGELSVSYAVNSSDGSDSYFNSTTYGQMYLTLLKRYFPSFVTFNGA